MADIDGKTVTLGGKGSSLSPAIIHAISAGLAAVRIDSSVQDEMIDEITATNGDSPRGSYTFASLYEFSLEERRAAFTVLLHKFLNSRSGVRKLIPEMAYKGLSSNESPEGLSHFSVTNDELCLLERSHFYLYGVSALLDYELTALSTVVDAVAALSCEAIKADISAFNLMDSGDGFTSKEEIRVANNMKVFLNGSKLVGGQVNCIEVSNIPKIHASLRNAVKLVQAETRINLNSSVKVGPGLLLGMADALLPLLAVGESSFNRVKRNLDSITYDSLRSTLVPMFESKCLQDLGSKFKPIIDAYISKNYNSFAHELYGFCKSVWEIVAWELVTAFASVEGAELSRKGQEGEGDEQGEKQSEKKKKKKKKVVLGKGTNAIVQLVKGMVQNNNEENAEKAVNDIWLSFNTKNPEFNNVLKIFKEIVQSNDTRRLPKIPKGTRDFSKGQMAIREKVLSIITEIFKKRGATELDTPDFELKETLTGKYGEDAKLIYDLADQGGELCSLRYDLTVPFARYVAMTGKTSFKRYQRGKVHRRDNPSKGRYREFYQYDFDIAGQDRRMGPDFDVVCVLTEVLDTLDIGGYEVKLNHRKLLDGMLEICGVPPEKFRTICSSIDKMDKQSFGEIKKEMVEEKGLTEEIADAIGDFVKERGRPLELLKKLKAEGSKFLQNEGCVDALNDLEILFNDLEAAQCIDKIVFDLSLARGLDYYTGVIFEAVSKGTTQVGSIAAGGRYDNLIGMFGTKQVPAVGVSLGIERIFVIMEDRNQNIRATETQVLVAFLGDDSTEAIKLVSQFWRAGLKAEYLVNKRLMKHIDYAKESEIPYMVLVGANELKDGVVKLKDMEAFTEETVSRDKIVQKLKDRLGIRDEANVRLPKWVFLVCFMSIVQFVLLIFRIF